MITYNNNKNCLQCEVDIEEKVFSYSSFTLGHALCRKCQNWFRDILDYSSATDEAIDLYFALKRRGVPAQLEKNDGFKTIDIAVPHAKVNIEVDGGHHNYSSWQAMSDLKRTLHSYKKGYTTLRIPNSLAKNDLEEAADIITEYLVESRNKRKS
jgi:hypothetical protein